MLVIACPFCGPRAENEFLCGGEPVRRPDAATGADGAALAELLYVRDNVRGPQDEFWWHKHGCRAWFRIRRDTRDNRILP
jgi:heterotetrameric sarcosine oxidase delta subunit